MTHISILDKEIKGLNEIKTKLDERDAFVSIIKNFEDLKNLQTSTLIVSEKIVKSDNELINIARSLKIKKVILVNNQSKDFSIKKELGEALVKIKYPTNDIYGLEVFLSFCTEDQKFLTGSKESLSLKNLAKKVASTDVTVFINGPTGSGKEVLANYLHEYSPRKNEPFVAVNCAAIPENMLEAILFGHEKGAFTGASYANKGIFRAADKGTLLLDEISEMPLSLQAKLLRVLQEKKVTPVGGQRDIEIDVRVLATSNRNMVTEVKQSRFREDLYYRLNVFPLQTKNLKDRKDDIFPISLKILDKHCKEKHIPIISSEAQEIILNHDWPGNVRELENTLQRALVLCEGDKITKKSIMIDKSLNNMSSDGQVENFVDRYNYA